MRPGEILYGPVVKVAMATRKATPSSPTATARERRCTSSERPPGSAILPYPAGRARTGVCPGHSGSVHSDSARSGSAGSSPVDAGDPSGASS